MKYLLWALAIWLAWRWLTASGRAAAATEARAAAGSERMVQCAQCGVHLPESEAVGGEGGFFCCNEHRLATRARD